MPMLSYTNWQHFFDTTSGAFRGFPWGMYTEDMANFYDKIAKKLGGYGFADDGLE